MRLYSNYHFGSNEKDIVFVGIALNDQMSSPLKCTLKGGIDRIIFLPE